MMNQRAGILSPTYYLPQSNWLFQESKRRKWTPEENKRFENALALYDKDTPDRWAKVAGEIPNKTVDDVINQYKELEEDVSDIEAGFIPIPGYDSNSFTLQWINNQGFDKFRQPYTSAVKRCSSTRPSEQERKKGVSWTEEEHRQFLMGLKKYGKGDWRSISRNFVTTRTPTQVASHAQKYFIRQLNGGKDKRRSSIHDITIVNFQDSKSPSQAINKAQLPAQSAKFSDQLHHHPMRSPNERMTMVLRTSDSNMFVAPFYGISSNVPKLPENNVIGGSVHGSEIGSFNTFFQ